MGPGERALPSFLPQGSLSSLHVEMLTATSAQQSAPRRPFGAG